MLKTLCAAWLVLLVAPVTQAADLSARIVDEQGNAVDDFEAMWHTADNGYGLWEHGRNGVWRIRPSIQGAVVDLIVRAPGFASRMQRLEGESLQTFRDGKATVVLERGTPVIIEAQDLASPIPADFVMESFFPDYAERVHMMWQPANIRGKKPDWNMLNVQKVDDKRFSVRLSKSTGEFFLAFQHPGWLQFCEFGPFTAESAVAGTISLPMPAPAKIRVTFDPKRAVNDRPFDSAKITVYWVPDDSGSIYDVSREALLIDEKNPVTLSDLGPGKYQVEVRTNPKNGTTAVAGTDLDSGRFIDAELVSLTSGKTAEVPFAWTPYDPHAFRGTAKADLRVTNSDGTVPSGRSVEVSWFDGHYGSLSVFKGPLPKTGVVRLDGVSAARHRYPVPFGPYTVAVDGERLGFFALEDKSDLQEFSFAISPKAGDIAPDIELIVFDSTKRQKLSDYRGKVVFLEFWSTGCGPCQPAMQKLSDIAKNMPAGWTDKVVLLGVSTDRDVEQLRTHITSRGWQGMPQFLAGRKDGEYFSDAEKLYVIMGIPHSILIDQRGVVRWRGHPLDEAEKKTVNDRITELLR